MKIELLKLQYAITLCDNCRWHYGNLVGLFDAQCFREALTCCIDSLLFSAPENYSGIARLPDKEQIAYPAQEDRILGAQ